MPGGQYTNLYQQAQALGVEARWTEVCRMYAEVNRLLGDIVKVTPTSKVVGDLALFMVANNLTADEVEKGRRDLAFPDSVVEFFEGKMGQPVGRISQRPCRAECSRDANRCGAGRERVCRPPISRPTRQLLARERGKKPDGDQRPRSGHASALSTRRGRLRQPSVPHGDTSILPTPVFFHGMEPGEEISVDIEEGKTLIIKFLTVGDPHLDGRRLVFFELNGQPREVLVVDRSLADEVHRHPKADAGQSTARGRADARFGGARQCGPRRTGGGGTEAGDP